MLSCFIVTNVQFREEVELWIECTAAFPTINTIIVLQFSRKHYDDLASLKNFSPLSIHQLSCNSSYRKTVYMIYWSLQKEIRIKPCKHIQRIWKLVSHDGCADLYCRYLNKHGRKDNKSEIHLLFCCLLYFGVVCWPRKDVHTMRTKHLVFKSWKETIDFTPVFKLFYISGTPAWILMIRKTRKNLRNVFHTLSLYKREEKVFLYFSVTPPQWVIVLWATSLRQ